MYQKKFIQGTIVNLHFFRYFVLKINELVLEDKLYNELNEHHLYSDTISRSKSYSSRY